MILTDHFQHLKSMIPGITHVKLHIPTPLIAVWSTNRHAIRRQELSQIVPLLPETHPEPPHTIEHRESIVPVL